MKNENTAIAAEFEALQQELDQIKKDIQTLKETLFDLLEENKNPLATNLL